MIDPRPRARARLWLGLLAGCTVLCPLRGGAEEADDAVAPPPPAAGVAGECVVETITSRQTVPLSARTSFALEAAGARPQLVWGASRDRRAPLEDVLALRFPGSLASPLAPQTLILRDGTELRGEVTGQESDPDNVGFTASGISPDPLTVSLDHVKGLLVDPVARPAAGAKAPGSKTAGPALSRSLLRLKNEIIRSAPTKDILVLPGGGRTQGVLDALGRGGAKLSSEGLGDVRVELDKLRGVIVAELEPREKKPEPAPDPASVHAQLRDGSTIVGTLVGFEQGHAVIQTSHIGERRVHVDSLLELSFRGGRLQYLSDLEPSKVDERLPAAFTANRFPYQRDASVVEGPIRMGGREHSKGLGVHSYSCLEYQLAPGTRRFQATIGLDETARPTGTLITGTEGAVIFRVKVDGKPLLEKAMTWRDAPHAVDVDVAGGKVLALEVDCGSADDARGVLNFSLDRANWADARIVR